MTESEGGDQGARRTRKSEWFLRPRGGRCVDTLSERRVLGRETHRVFPGCFVYVRLVGKTACNLRQGEKTFLTGKRKESGHQNVHSIKRARWQGNRWRRTAAVGKGEERQCGQFRGSLVENTDQKAFTASFGEGPRGSGQGYSDSCSPLQYPSGRTLKRSDGRFRSASSLRKKVTAACSTQDDQESPNVYRPRA